jgi:hypothetical protein
VGEIQGFRRNLTDAIFRAPRTTAQRSQAWGRASGSIASPGRWRSATPIMT